MRIDSLKALSTVLLDFNGRYAERLSLLDVIHELPYAL